ncbi:uncharacterized protein EDB93DRAFT_1130600 [Suillus bovinus]|uniref:uncharacterized protein n=1 Tax=Suillus bovinus TaxID=48563 RepID=UPI001B87D0A8|nr:uncharacterized protein EDB93DRAFT_1130600 [Suillus bovinus]KAG2154984.1 hypothetical protein EDB93DRAFT_1130600 [Suillus bovinus]
MNISHSIPSTVSSISFSFLTAEDIRRISVKQILNPVLLDDLNRPNIGGLYDPALGPSDRQDICATCHLTYFTCPGHFGHIELPAPVYHPLFMVNMYNILRATCLFCHRFKLSRSVICKYVAKFRLLEHGLLEAALDVDNITSHTANDDDEDSRNETIPELESRVNLFVTVHLSKASGSKRDHYKDSLVYQARKDLIQEFLKTTITKKCSNEGCGAFAYTFRKEGFTKIIEYDLSVKQKNQHRAISLKRPDVLLFQQQAADASKSRSEPSNTMDVDSESDSEPEGEPTYSDEEEELQATRLLKKNDLPRAANGKVKTTRGRNERVMAPEECRAHLRLLFRNCPEICSLIFGRHGPFSPLNAAGLSLASADMFFMEVIPVPPTRFRPPATMGETLFEHPQNELLAKVLNTSYRLRDLNADLHAASVKQSGIDDTTRRRLFSALLEGLVQLQADVNSFMDSNKNPTPVRNGKLPPAGVKQGLEKKEGLFRKHMMGKRVNYAARSVISPDINIEPNEIGIPPVFARKLTFPEPVTPANFHELRQWVITGPKGYPGATMVEYEDGHKQSLEKLTPEQRTAIANQLLTPQDGSDSSSGRRGLSTRTASINKKVYRHLRDGDILILNRQPTLHKPSMMCHKARILRGEKTIRMHYANCNSYNGMHSQFKPYNPDFDGDEMNIHFPQNQVARAEAMLIANTENQYLVPTSGKPLRGLIQDHVVAGVWMTCQDAFFSREEYFQLLYGALRPEDESHHLSRLITLPPTIWKPRPLWTGKQVISTVLKNITPSNCRGAESLIPKLKFPVIYGTNIPQKTRLFLLMANFSVVSLTNPLFGATDYGLVHSVYELYGADVAGKLLGVLSRLFTKFLQHRAFTFENFPSLSKLPKEEDVLRDDNKMAGLDVTVKTKLSGLTKSIADACMPHGLLRKFPHNHMQTMTLSGAKGSAVNAQQISCALGQQELEGRRVPVMVSGKTLPSFKSFEPKAMAGGYVASRFLTGIKPQEFYFHCMAGREGLIDTAVKTSRSGYLQRCLIKHLEGIRVHYDHTVRGSDSSIYQFHYGGDALDVTKQKHLYQFEFIARNQITLLNLYKPKNIAGHINDNDAVSYMKKTLKKSEVRPDKYTPAEREKRAPSLDVYSPSRYLGSTSEKFAEALAHYIKSNPHGLLMNKDKNATEGPKIKRRHEPMKTRYFNLLMNIKYLRSLVEPGEAVGLLASQGVGEPSTQMTLNTFHFAGHGAANVTLGIPRLREIVMTASQKPKTPSMTMEVAHGVSQLDIDIFCKRASKLTLSQLVDNVTVKERLTVESDARRTEFVIDIFFFPAEEYTEEYDILPEEVLAVFAAKFPSILKKEIQTEMKKLDTDLKGQIAQLGKGKASKEPVAGEAEAEGGEDDDPSRGKDDDGLSEQGDGDAVDAKRARQQKEQTSYESDNDSERDYLDDTTIEAAYASDTGGGEGEGDDIIDRPTAIHAQTQVIADAFMNIFHQATSFTFTKSKCSIRLEFPADFPKILLVGIVERTCLRTVIREIPGITDCFSVVVKERGVEKIRLTTNGSNLRGIWQFTGATDDNIIDLDTIYSNDIYSILKAYGVEMARAAILREIGGVFDAYKIDVDGRHLELIADYMTFEGAYKPFNRKGLSSNPSPLLKASYETTAAFLSDATLYGDFDDLSTPSGNLVMGRPNQTGTGVFDVVTLAEVPA